MFEGCKAEVYYSSFPSPFLPLSFLPRAYLACLCTAPKYYRSLLPPKPPLSELSTSLRHTPPPISLVFQPTRPDQTYRISRAPPTPPNRTPRFGSRLHLRRSPTAFLLHKSQAGIIRSLTQKGRGRFSIYLSPRNPNQHLLAALYIPHRPMVQHHICILRTLQYRIPGATATRSMQL